MEEDKIISIEYQGYIRPYGEVAMISGRILESDFLQIFKDSPSIIPLTFKYWGEYKLEEGISNPEKGAINHVKTFRVNENTRQDLEKIIDSCVSKLKLLGYTLGPNQTSV